MKATRTKVRVLKPKLALGQKLKAFKPATHGGEAGISGLVGAEVFGKGFDHVTKAGDKNNPKPDAPQQSSPLPQPASAL
jgi:hypothetical protein